MLLERHAAVFYLLTPTSGWGVLMQRTTSEACYGRVAESVSSILTLGTRESYKIWVYNT